MRAEWLFFNVPGKCLISGSERLLLSSYAAYWCENIILKMLFLVHLKGELMIFIIVLCCKLIVTCYGVLWVCKALVVVFVLGQRVTWHVLSICWHSNLFILLFSSQTPRLSASSRTLEQLPDSRQEKLEATTCTAGKCNRRHMRTTSNNLKNVCDRQLKLCQMPP